LDQNKSLDYNQVVATLLIDVQSIHSEVYTPRDMKLDQRKLTSRASREGISLLTKALPRLCKAFDKALQGEVSFDSTGFIKEPGSQLPKFLGGLFKRIFTPDGWVLPTPCVSCIKSIRQVLLVFYKLELPYEQDQEQEVIDQFEKTDDELLDVSLRLSHLASRVDYTTIPSRIQFDWYGKDRIIKLARKRLSRLFQGFDERDITPSHGPGAVSTRERYERKWTFSNISPRLTAIYPLDSYFYASLGHVCDDYQSIAALKEEESPARVCLVPKDSRGPRLISCEPLDFQWIQQGLSRAIVKRVESHPLTRWNVNFTNQRPNQLGALLGSLNGKYATLDLKEASDRISVGLVHLLFPEPLLTALMNSRSLSTELPGGKIRTLNKFAPMGSALCFPVLALCIWSILSAAAPDAYTRERILVYGDDVIVPTAFAADAIEHLESFGLLVNRDKSCTKGFFRESCGTDAYAGVEVTPVRIRTEWSSTRCPHVYASYIAYCNALHAKRYINTYEYISSHLFKVYGHIPEKGTVSTDLSLVDVPAIHRPRNRRVNKNLQKLEFKVWDLESVKYDCEIEGWKMLLRFFTEGQRPPSRNLDLWRPQMQPNTEMDLGITQPFAVRSYTKRKTVKLVSRWR
jgi:hypothetical protein